MFAKGAHRAWSSRSSAPGFRTVVTVRRWEEACDVVEGSAPSATRTRDLLLRRQLLYPLSYRGRAGGRTRPKRAGTARPDLAPGQRPDRAAPI